ncbi:hypothetical protein EDB80DRAFT_880174 [Ilyonectria destructans]|nr:hypothetical protein EDB80DRAFT_880174 [Ilyonectria destructans]
MPNEIIAPLCDRHQMTPEQLAESIHHVLFNLVKSFLETRVTLAYRPRASRWPTGTTPQIDSSPFLSIPLRSENDPARPHECFNRAPEWMAPMPREAFDQARNTRSLQDPKPNPSVDALSQMFRDMSVNLALNTNMMQENQSLLLH